MSVDTAQLWHVMRPSGTTLARGDATVLSNQSGVEVARVSPTQSLLRVAVQRDDLDVGVNVLVLNTEALAKRIPGPLWPAELFESFEPTRLAVIDEEESRHPMTPAF